MRRMDRGKEGIGNQIKSEDRNAISRGGEEEDWALL